MAKPVCLIVITAQRYSPEFGEAALASARTQGEDVVVDLVLDPDVSDSVAERLAEAGVLGERLAQDLRDTMDREYRERGEEILVALAARAVELGLRAQTRTTRGPFVESVRDEAAACGAGRVIVAQLSHSPLARALFGSDSGRLRRRLPVPLELLDLSGHVVSPASRLPER